MHDPSDEPDLRVMAVLTRLEQPLLIAVSAVSGGVLVLWLLPTSVTSALPGLLLMKPTTAIGMLLAAGSLALSAPGGSPSELRLSKVASVVVLMLGLLALLTYAGAIPSSSLSLLPSPQTSIAFALIGVCLFLVRHAKNRFSSLADICAIVLIAFLLFLLGGHLFKVVEFVGIGASNLTSRQTLFCFFLLAFVIAARQALGGGRFSILVNGGIGSRILRVVLTGILVAPFALFVLIQYLDDAGILPAAQTRAIATPVIAVVVLGVVAWMARITNTLERRLRLQSVTDQLTNVLNRRGFEAVADYAMRNARRMGSGLIVFYFDLDGLKRVNDSIGHDAGSLMIRRFAELLVATFRKNDVIARVGGDEFVVLAVGTSTTVVDMLDRLAGSVAECNASGSVPGGIAYSVGHAEILPRADTQMDEVIAQADKMMYQHKLHKTAA
jgi:diguanylate cyclase (GGDEF)-like protein